MTTGFAQDTLSIFYASGEYKLSPSNKELLKDFVLSHDLRDLDSVFVLGYTDSTGNARKNKKLSARRANDVDDFVRGLLSAKTKYRISAVGEETEAANPRINHRRVELILFGKNYYHPEERNPLRPTVSANKKGDCYRVYDSVMLNVYLSPYKRGATNYYKVRIPSYALPKMQLYSMSPASLQAKPLKWKTEKMGRFWWQQLVYTTLVKERDWNTYGLLVKAVSDSASTCRVCEYDSDVPTFRYTNSPDIAVMQYCQIYKRLWSKKQTLLVPTEFVNVNLPYYFDREQDYPLNWYQWKSKRGTLYYCAAIPEKFNDSTVVVFSNHRHCNDSIEQFIPKYETESSGMHRCLNTSDSQGGAAFVGLEAGFRKTAYLGLYAGYEYARFNMNYTLGIDYLLQMQHNLALDLTLWSFSAVRSRSYLTRKTVEVHEFHPQFWIYSGLGVAGMHSLRVKNWELLPNVHLGFAYKQPYLPWRLERIFAEMGGAYAFSSNSNRMQFYFRFGVRFKI